MLLVLHVFYKPSHYSTGTSLQSSTGTSPQSSTGTRLQSSTGTSPQSSTGTSPQSQYRDQFPINTEMVPLTADSSVSVYNRLSQSSHQSLSHTVSTAVLYSTLCVCVAFIHTLTISRTGHTVGALSIATDTTPSSALPFHFPV